MSDRQSDTFARRYGRWALIAGSAEGMGIAYAERFARRGLDLVLLDRDGAGLEAQAKTLADGGFRMTAICAGRNQSPEDLADLVARLREAGAEYIFMVNSTPELNEAAMKAGADELVRNGLNLSVVLTATLDRLGVEVKA